jgi:uncharacterized protein YuzE
MRLKYDLNVGALYVRLTDQPVARTREVDDNTFIDLDGDGHVIGIEVVSITHPWALDEVLRGYQLPADEEAQLRAYFRSPALGATPGAPALGTTPEAPALSMEPNAAVCVPA